MKEDTHMQLIRQDRIIEVTNLRKSIEISRRQRLNILADNSNQIIIGDTER